MIYKMLQKYSKKIINLFKIIYLSKLYFKIPLKNEIIIFDTEGSEKINDCFVFKTKPNILDVRRNEINIYVLIYSFFKFKYKEYKY